VRALLVTAGLLVLAGAAAAGQPTGHTLRKSPGGPIEALAADGPDVAWFTSSSQGCDEVHVLTPGKHDRISPQPATPSMTCRWDTSNGLSQLAVASRSTTVLWTLSGNPPSSFDEVLAGRIGGSERQVRRLSRASDGTGDRVVDVAGAGGTLAYSWDDVEYVDKLACLSGGSCKEKIAGGGIRTVYRTHGNPPGAQDQPLPGAQPALQLAAAAGRIAYVPATMAKGSKPSTGTNNTLEIVDAATGDVLGQPFVRGIPIGIALSSHVFAVLTTQSGPRDRISWFSATDGTKLGSVLVSAGAAQELATSGKLIVYRVGLLLRGISTQNGHIRTLAKTGYGIADFALAHGRLVWTENHGNNGRQHGETGRLRALSVG
jgi:hypothetical protein